MKKKKKKKKTARLDKGKHVFQDDIISSTENLDI